MARIGPHLGSARSASGGKRPKVRRSRRGWADRASSTASSAGNDGCALDMAEHYNSDRGASRVQNERFNGLSARQDAQLTSRKVGQYCWLAKECRNLLKLGLHELGLSGEAPVPRVARHCRVEGVASQPGVLRIGTFFPFIGNLLHRWQSGTADSVGCSNRFGANEIRRDSISGSPANRADDGSIIGAAACRFGA